MKQISLPFFNCSWFWKSICIQNLSTWNSIQYWESILRYREWDLYFKRQNRLSITFCVPGERLEDHLANLCQTPKLTQGWRSGTSIWAKFHTNRKYGQLLKMTFMIQMTWQSKYFQHHPNQDFYIIYSEKERDCHLGNYYQYLWDCYKKWIYRI